MRLNLVLQRLIRKGVNIPNPWSLEVGEDLDPERIHRDVTIHAGCRLFGAKTSIGAGCVLGAEAPVTIDNCQLGQNVKLKGGYHAGAVFLDGANMGSGAHVRAGTILEEEANGAHTVGLKQTILLPFATLGSLINFCDVLMAGGTSRKDHSEVGSSYIHFNYTPQQDKATASLIGDVPRGVMMDQRPIFLGGQGGLIGPVRVEYGVTVGAGSMVRKDILSANQIYIPKPMTELSQPNNGRALYFSIDRKLRNNLIYIGNLIALKQWYLNIRKPLMAGDDFSKACFDGALTNLNGAIKERISRIGKFVDKLPDSIEQLGELEQTEKLIIRQKELGMSWPVMVQSLEKLSSDPVSVPNPLTEALETSSSGYMATVKSFSPEVKAAGVNWLQDMVDQAAAIWE